MEETKSVECGSRDRFRLAAFGQKLPVKYGRIRPHADVETAGEGSAGAGWNAGGDRGDGRLQTTEKLSAVFDRVTRVTKLRASNRIRQQSAEASAHSIIRSL